MTSRSTENKRGKLQPRGRDVTNTKQDRSSKKGKNANGPERQLKIANSDNIQKKNSDTDRSEVERGIGNIKLRDTAQQVRGSETSKYVLHLDR